MVLPRHRVLGLAVAFCTILGSSASAAATPVTLGPTGSTPRGIAVGDDGSIYTVSGYSGQVFKTTQAGQSVAVTSPLPLAGGAGAQTVLIDHNNAAYVANTNGDDVKKFSLTTGDWLATLSSGLRPWALAVDASGNLFSANADSNSVTRVSAIGHSETFALVGSNPRALAVDTNGNVYVANRDWDSVTKITASGTASHFASVGDGPSAIAVHSNGTVYVANALDNTVTKILPDGSVSLLGSTGGDPRAITIDSSGNVYTANHGVSTVTRFTSAGASTLNWSTTGTNPVAITVDSEGFIYTTNSTSGNITRISGGSPAPPSVPNRPSVTLDRDRATVSVSTILNSRRYGAPTSLLVRAVQDSALSCTISPPASTCAISGLRFGTPYSFVATASLGDWTTAASSASELVTATGPSSDGAGSVSSGSQLPATSAKNRVPTTPRQVLWTMLNQKRSVTASFKPEAGTNYSIRAILKKKTASGRCSVKQGTVTCTISLKSPGRWSVAITPSRGGVTGKPASKVIRV